MRRLGGVAMGGTSVRSLVAAALVAVLAGCGGRDDPGPAGGGTVRESTSEEPTPTASGSLPEPTPTWEPATGPRLDVEGIRVNAPEKWKQTYDTFAVDMAQTRGASLHLSVGATAGEQLSLKQAERYFWNTKKPPEGYEPQDHLVMGGLTAIYYTARDRFDSYHVVSMWDSGYVVKVMLVVDRAMPDDRQRELLDSVIATYESPRTS